LGHAESLSRPAEMELFGNGDEIPELPQVDSIIHM
jgi:hypothetical protein